MIFTVKFLNRVGRHLKDVIKKYNGHISVNYCDFLRVKCITVEISIEPYLNLTMEKNIPNSRIDQKTRSIMKSNAQLLDGYFESYDLKKA